MNYPEMLRKDADTSAPRPDIQLSLTDEQYRRLKSQAYQVGFDTPSELLASFVADLTGIQRNGSDECNLANNWLRRAFGIEMETAYFRQFLANTYPYTDEYQDILDDEEWFNELYEDYTGWGIGMDLQSAEDCKSVMKRLIDKYNASAGAVQHQ